MPVEGLAGPPGWLVTAFRYAVGTPDSSSIIDAQIRAARDAGYTGSRARLIAIGQGLRNASAIAAGQGGGPGSPDRGPIGNPSLVARRVDDNPAVPGPVAPQAIFYTRSSGPIQRTRKKKKKRAAQVQPILAPPGGADGLLDELLKKTYNPGNSPGRGSPDFEELLKKKRGDPDFQRLMEKDFRPRGGALLGVLARASVLIGGVLYPRDAGRGSDRRGEVFPKRGPPGGPKGPRTRPIVRGLPRPGSLPTETRPSPQRAEPQATPNRPVLPRTFPSPLPTPKAPRAPLPAPRPRGVPSTVPRSVPASTALSPLPLLLPFLMPGNRASPRSAFGPGTATDPAYRPSVINSPLTALLTSPLSSGSGDNCRCPPSNRKPRKKSCSNPIVRKRTTTKGGAKFQTITRELKCPA